MSGCSFLTPVEYKEKHDKIKYYIHSKIVNIMEYWIMKNEISTNQN